MSMTKYGVETVHITEKFDSTLCGKKVDASIKVAAYDSEMEEIKYICPNCLAKYKRKNKK